MIDDPTPTPSVEDALLARSARHLKHFTRMKKTEIGVNEFAWSIQRTVTDAHAANPMDLCDMLVAQSRVLDGAFGWFLDRAADDPDSAFVSVAMAMKAQQQTLRTLLTWKHIKDDSRIDDITNSFRQRERALLEEMRRRENAHYGKFDFTSLHDPGPDVDQDFEKRDERTVQTPYDQPEAPPCGGPADSAPENSDAALDG